MTQASSSPFSITVDPPAGGTTLLAENFVDPAWYAKWHNPYQVKLNNDGTNNPRRNPAYTSTPANCSRISSSYSGEGFSPRTVSGQTVPNYLKITIPQGENTGTTLSFFPRYVLDPGCWADPLPYHALDPRELYMEYFLMFGNTWKYSTQTPSPSQSGKLPGFAGTYMGSQFDAGYGGNASYGNNGFSARGGYNGPICSNGRVQHDSYVYYGAMMADGSAPANPYGRGLTWMSCANAMLPGTWYKVKQYMKMNTRSPSYVWNSDPNLDGPDGASNGILRTWVNDLQAAERTDYRWTDVPWLNIERAWFDVYHGGSNAAPTALHLFLSDVRIWMP